jgi:tellurium resistance protein TerD
MASINLVKGGRVDLYKEAPSLKKIGVGLGWDANSSDTGKDFDLDASAFMLSANGKVPASEFFIFYNNLKSPDGSVLHSGDNLKGDGDGDDETILVDLTLIPVNISELIFVVTIYEATTRGQNFGQVKNSYIRIYDQDTKVELLKYDLEENFSIETALEFGRLYKKDGSWRFQAVGTGYKFGLQAFVDKYV